jgi:ABC-type transporter Mla subunit MlaD
MDILLDYLSGAGSTISRFFVQLIYALFLLGILSAIYILARTIWERQLVNWVQKKAISVLNDPSYVGLGREEDVYRFKNDLVVYASNQSKFALKRLIPQSTVVQLLTNLSDLRKQEGQSPQNPLAGYRDIGVGFHTRTGRILPSVLVALGLLGTICGLAESISSMPVLFDEGSVKTLDDIEQWTKQSRQAMAGVITGLKTAFSTTMAGLVTSVLLTGAYLVIGWQRSIFLYRLERFATITLIPVYFPDKMNSATSLGEALRHASGLIGNTTDRLADTYAVLETELTTLCDFARNNNEATENLVKNHVRLEQMHTELQGAVTSVGQQIGNFNSQMEKAVDRLEKGQDNNRLILTQSINSLETKLVNVLGQFRDDQQNFLRTTNARSPSSEQVGALLTVLSETQKQTGELSGANGEVRDAIQQLIVFLGQQNKASQAQEGLNTDLNALVSGLKPDDVRAGLANLSESGDTLQKILVQLQSEGGLWSKFVSQRFGHLFGKDEIEKEALGDGR